MSNDDILDLDRRATAEPATVATMTNSERKILVETGADVAQGLVRTVTTLVEIHRIRVQADAEVATVEARTRQLEAAARGQLALLREQGEHLRDQGRLGLELVRSAPAILASIPDFDTQSRVAFLEGLPELLRTLLDRR